MKQKVKIIIGPPGCGKTWTLLDQTDKLLEKGIRPERILYSTFTKKGANEAILRACDKFKFRRAQLPYFRTLHSLAFQELQLSREDVMQMRDYKTIGKALGLEFGWIDMEDGLLMPSANTGDRMLYVIGMARARMVPVEEQYNELGYDFSWHELKQLMDTIDEYKAKRGLVDFSDMIGKFIESGKACQIDAAIIDEAQDLSRQQWKMVWQATGNASEMYIAGDDDQAIYKWSGADVETFLTLDGKKSVLKKSYRLPRSVHSIANKIASRIKNRYDKAWGPRDEEGSVAFVNSIRDIEIAEGTYLILARNKYLLKAVEEFLQSEGFPYTTSRGSSINKEEILAIRTWEGLRKGKEYDVDSVRTAYQYLKSGSGVAHGHKGLRGATGRLTMKILAEKHGLLVDQIWHDSLLGIERAEYYLAALRRGENLDNPPRIHISTIHGVKGGEADHVVLLTDMAYKTFQSMREDPDEEHRVFYVGATRARQTLQIIEPQTNMYYSMP